MQVRTISPREPETFPVRRSRISPDFSSPTQVWQMPSRQPNGRREARVLAGHQDRLAAVRAAPGSRS